MKAVGTAPIDSDWNRSMVYSGWNRSNVSGWNRCKVQAVGTAPVKAVVRTAPINDSS